MQNGFGEPFWRTGLQNRRLGQQLWRGVLGSSFGKQLWGTALGSSFGNLSGTTLRKNCFEEQQLWEQLSGAALQLPGAAFSSNFREQLSGAALQNSFGGAVLGNRFEESQLWGNSFGQQLWGATLGRSFREPL